MYTAGYIESERNKLSHVVNTKGEEMLNNGGQALGHVSGGRVSAPVNGTCRRGRHAGSQDVKPKLVTITPAEAQRILEEDNYDDNRKISQPWVEYLARQMVGKLWKLNGEPIIFDEDGKLLNGQHRLSAVVLYGQSVEFLVVYGVDASTFTTMDQNRVRSAGQVLGMKGEKSGFLLAAICRKIYCWEHEGHLGGKRKISPDELQQVLDEHTSLRRSATLAERICKEVPVDGSMVAFCHWLFSQANAKRAEQFFETLETSVADSKKNPVIVLRRRFFKERERNHRRWGPTELLAIFVRCWNYYAKNEEISNLAIKPDQDGSYAVPAVHGLGRGQGGKASKTLVSVVGATPVD